jgi:DNA-binding SARP family transcriptional activator/tetratricopeptide (TPR) repeat protein
MAAIPTGLSARLTITVAGTFGVTRDGAALADHEIGSRKARLLLYVLASHRGRPVALPSIVAALWGDRPPARPADNVSTLVSRLRATLGPEAIAGDRDGYRLGEAVRVDLDLAQRHLAEARRRQPTEPALARAAAEAAIQLVEAPAAEGPDWAEDVRIEAAQIAAAARLIAAETALGLGDPRGAIGQAEAVIAADAFDEHAYRLVMRGQAAVGAPARALAAYEQLRGLLADEFGVDPAPETRDLHLAILREEAGPAPVATGRSDRTAATAPAVQPKPGGLSLVGRDAEIATLTAAWTSAAGGTPALVLICGEAGIGKTRLSREIMEIASATGGVVLTARCYETERSLFLQPIAEALGQHAAHTAPTQLRRLAGDGAGPLAALVPEIDAALGRVDLVGDPEVQRQRAYRAVTDYLCRLADSPVLLVLDDLHTTGLATVELLHYLIRRAGAARLLVVGTVRSDESATAIEALVELATMIDLGPLAPTAVAQLAAGAGHADRADTISARTGGHPLFVVETLRGLTAGADGVPTSLQAAVLSRVRRTGEAVERLLRAASVLGATVDVEPLASLLDLPTVQVTALCEQGLAARLLVVAGRAYEFANDLIREVLYATMPVPTRVAYHRRAADLLANRPEAVATHATAAGDRQRAARAWLAAGEDAVGRFAAADAEVMFGRAAAIATEIDDQEVRGRALLARGRVRDILTHYTDATEDLGEAVAVAVRTGDRRLELLARQALGNDIRGAVGPDRYESEDQLTAALRLALVLGDRTTESEILARLGIVSCNRLDLVAGQEFARRAVAAARAAHDEVALAAALDGLKTSYAYIGDNAALVAVIDELEPLLRQQKDLFRLQWLVQERAFGAIAAADWDAAMRQLHEALDVNRRSGYVAHEGWFVSHISWILRLRGHLDGALEWASRAVEMTRSGHAWWRCTAHAELGTTLMALGDNGSAREVLATGLALAPAVGAEAYQLRCLGPLAECTGDRDVLADADRALHSIKTPPGTAWLPGVNAYLCTARAWRAAGDPQRAEAILAPLRAAADRAGWRWIASAAA